MGTSVLTTGRSPGGRSLTEFLHDWPTPGTGPYFDTSVAQNITGLVGQPVHLLCRVKNLGNRTVSTLSFSYHKMRVKSVLFCLKVIIN